MRVFRHSLMIATLIFSNGLLASGLPTDTLKEVGSAKLTVWFWDIYQARLYSPDGKYQTHQKPIALKLKYLRDISREDLLQQTLDEWQRQELKSPEQESWLQQLANMWPDIQSGDELLLHIDDHGNSHFYYNGEAIGHVQDALFSQQFAAIWLSPNSRFPDVRRQLVGE